MAVMMAKTYILYKIDNKIYNKLHNKIYNIKVRFNHDNKETRRNTGKQRPVH